MTIRGTGNVGIGATSPNISGQSSDSAVLTITGSDQGFIELGGSRGSDANVGGIDFQNKGVRIATILGNRDGADNSGNFTFYTNNAGAGLAEVMRIDPNGNVGIGDSSPSNNLVVRDAAGSCTIEIDSAAGNPYVSQLKFTEGGTQRWILYNNNNNDKLVLKDEEGNNGMLVVQDGTEWVADSDERLKKNMTSITGAVDGLNTLRCVDFHYNWDSDDREKRMGLIAQDVYKVFPAATIGNPEDELDPDDHGEGNAMGIGYGYLVPVLVKAVQELSAKVESLEAQVSGSS